jgi:hypothetical protein
MANPETRNNGAIVVKERAQERADYLFASYLSLGRDRSLAKLHALLSGLGLKISMGTIKNYCARGKWIERAAEQDKATSIEKAEESNALATRVAELNHRHAQYGIALQRISFTGLRTLDPKSFSPTEVTNMLEKGIKLERLAEGEATDRHELTVQIVEPLVRQIATLFEQVNMMADAHARSRQFRIGADAIIVDNFREDVD